MDGDALKTMAEGLMADREFENETLFYQLLNNAKDKREMSRPWVYLRTVDSSNTVSSSNTFTTAISLPTGFINFVGKYPIKLVNGIEVIPLQERPIHMADELQSQLGYFVVDYRVGSIYIMGTLNKTYTVKIYLAKKSDEIEDDTEWLFPAQFHPLLAFDVALQEKGEISYDEINARMVKYHGVSVAELESAMIRWDAKMQTSILGV